MLDIRETMFDGGQYPPAEETKKLLAACAAASAEVQAPFSGQTCPHASSTIQDYEQRLERWFEQVCTSPLHEPRPVPTAEQMHILRSVQRRVLCEIRLAKMGEDLPRDTNFEEPMRGFIHGEPGTGKSKLIAWIRSMFEDGMGWTHGVHFLFVAVQNRVAFAMGGSTLHAGGDVRVGEQGSQKLDHLDLGPLFIRNQQLR